MPLVPCYTCEGSGIFPTGTETVCHTCNGDKVVEAAGSHSITQAFVRSNNERLILLQDTCADIQDKCADILEKCNEILDGQ